MHAWFLRKRTSSLRRRDLKPLCLESSQRFVYYYSLLSVYQVAASWYSGKKPFFLQIPSNKAKEAARFAQLWNRIITSFRDEDLINNRWKPLADRVICLSIWGSGFHLNTLYVNKLAGRWICCLSHIGPTMSWTSSNGLHFYLLAR